MSECKIYRRELGEAADGGVVSGGARAHAASCRACGEELREGSALRALVGGLGKVEAPADFEYRLRARLASEKGRGGGGRFGGLRFVYGLAPVAAAACFLVISATLYFRQAADTAPVRPAAAPPESARKVESNESTPLAARFEGGRESEGGRVVAAGPATLNTPAALARSRRERARRGHAGVAALRGAGRPSLAREKAVRDFGPTAGRPQGVTIALKAPAEPLRMVLRDERGARRVVSMRSVSFGSQDLLARETALREGADSKVEGVW